MSSDELTLLIASPNLSSWSLRPWLLLRQLRIPFTQQTIALDRGDTREKILRHSPSGKVPFLRHGAIAIWDSLAICEYIAELPAGRGAWPGDAASRAHARSIAAEMHAGFADLRRELPMNICGEGLTAAPSAGAQADIARIEEIWRDCRQRHAAKGPFLFGDFSIADAMYAPVATRFATYRVALDDVERDYADAILALPAMAEWRRMAEADIGAPAS